MPLRRAVRPAYAAERVDAVALRCGLTAAPWEHVVVENLAWRGQWSRGCVNNRIHTKPMHELIS